MELENQITVIKGIGEKTQKNFAKLDIFTVRDLLEHYPRGYDVYNIWRPINTIKEGEIAAIEASVFRIPQIKKVKNLQIVTCQVKDNSGMIVLRWFNMPFLRNTLKLGTSFIFRGKISKKNGVLTMEHPEILTKEEYQNRIDIWQPIYALTAGLTNHTIAKAAQMAIHESDITEDYLPIEIREKYQLIDYKMAIQQIHFPKKKEDMIEARKRIVFDEFFLFTLALNQLKKQKHIKKCPLPIREVQECQEILKNLPYELTNAQKKVWDEIKKDMLGEYSMNRLVQGDVGSGKTIIAVLALFMVAKNG